jgi:hypothetical protein
MFGHVSQDNAHLAIRLVAGEQDFDARSAPSRADALARTHDERAGGRDDGSGRQVGRLVGEKRRSARGRVAVDAGSFGFLQNNFGAARIALPLEKSLRSRSDRTLNKGGIAL